MSETVNVVIAGTPTPIILYDSNTLESARQAGFAAVSAANAALSEAMAESLVGPSYASTAAGLAATASGNYFAVDNGDGTVSIYLDNAGSAVFQRSLATTAALELAGVTNPSHANTYPDGTAGERFKRFIVATDAPYNVKMNNTSGAVITANTAAMNDIFADCAASGGGTIGLPNGELWTDGAMAWASNVKLWGMGGSVIRVKAGYNSYTFTGNALSNIEMVGVTFEGNGEPGNSMAYFTNSIGVKAEKNTITKAGGIALQFVACVGVTTRDNICNENYFYGIEFRDCVIAKSFGDTCNGNGDTGVASNAGGRGIMIWRCHDWLVTGATLNENTEYGFRNYSEAADGSVSYDGTFSDSTLVDNVRTDVVMYDEGAPGLINRTKVRGIKVTRTTVPTLGQSFLCHGSKIDYDDCSVYHDGALATYAAFNFFNATDNTLRNCRSRNVSVPISGHASVSNIKVFRFIADGCVNAFTIPTEGIRVEDSEFTHAGAGTSDVAIFNNATATGKNYYHRNKFIGFHTGIRTGGESVSIFDNETIDTVFAGIRLDGTSIAGLEAGGNIWDLAEPYEISRLEKRAATYDVPTTYHPSAPSVINFPQNSRCIRSTRTVGQPKAWSKTGPNVGDWTSEGNL